MWIEGNDNRRALRLARIGESPLDHRAMAEVDAIENANGQKDGARKRRKLLDFFQNPHRRLSLHAFATRQED